MRHLLPRAQLAVARTRRWLHGPRLGTRPCVESLTCPTCTADLLPGEDSGRFRCAEHHEYTVAGLALTTNIAALRAIWMAIRALEDDAASLRYLAEHFGGGLGATTDQRREEAEAAQAAAEQLREQARRAQQRLDALPVAPSAVGEDGAQRGRGG